MGLRSPLQGRRAADRSRRERAVCVARQIAYRDANEAGRAAVTSRQAGVDVATAIRARDKVEAASLKYAFYPDQVPANASAWASDIWDEYRAAFETASELAFDRFTYSTLVSRRLAELYTPTRVKARSRVATA